MFLKNLPYRTKKESSFQTKSDEELIRNYRENKEKKIIAVLFDRYIHLVFASCMKYYKDENNAQDAAMEIFESLPDKLLKYEIDYFKSWLYTLSRNHCLMQLRKKNIVDRIENIEKIAELSVENQEVTHLINDDESLDSNLRKCLEELKDEQRICVELMYLKGLSYKDIVLETGFELKHVKSFIQNGKRNLKQKLEKLYGEEC